MGPAQVHQRALGPGLPDQRNKGRGIASGRAGIEPGGARGLCRSVAHAEGGAAIPRPGARHGVNRGEDQRGRRWPEIGARHIGNRDHRRDAVGQRLARAGLTHGQKGQRLRARAGKQKGGQPVVWHSTG